MNLQPEKKTLSREDFNYDLPKELIAQHPASERTKSRLLHLDRDSGRCRHLVFADLGDLVRSGDMLVMNNTRVFPARLMATRSSGGLVEIFLLEYPGERDEVPCFVKPARKIKENEVLSLDDGREIEIVKGRGGFRVRALEGHLSKVVEDQGYVPLPPYIMRKGREHEDEDRQRYQTVFAKESGAVAAPTAGLHFDDSLLNSIRSKGVNIEAITLHVGPGTFQPVRVQDIRDHEMMSEVYEIPAKVAQAVRTARQSGGRVVAVGTTVVRALETASSESEMRAGTGETDLFIYPGYKFNVVDTMLTNFHLPESTLLMLVCAFAGRDKVMAAYKKAVNEGYRFYSYGDAMLIS